MKTFSFITTIIFTMAIVACNTNSGSGPSLTADSAFQKLSEDYIKGYLAARPEQGVGLGLHEFDGKTTDYSKANLENELARLKEYDQKLGVLDTTALSPKMFYDYRILRSAIKSEIFRFEDMAIFTNNPMTYAGAIDVSIYVKRNFGSLEDRVKSIIAIENKAAEVFTAAKVNLADSLAKPYIETAIEIAKGSADFLGGDLVVALKDLKDDSLIAAFKATNKTAINQINGFVDYLQKEKLPKAHNHYALGKDLYSKMLLYEENISMSPEDILAIGLKELKKEQVAFNAAAHIINPNKKPVDVYHDIQKEHPTADSLIPFARKKLDGIKQFLADKKIVSMPSQVMVHVEETPQYARATSTASMDTPGPFEEKATEAYYYITPVNPTWTPKQKEDWLDQFDFYTTDNVSIHEVYPGHYTQFLHLNASGATKIEKIFGSYAFIEGWAHYCEKMMADEGYGATGDPVVAAKYRIAQAGDALLRLCRLCVSIKTHCEGISVDEGTQFFMNNWYQGDKPSRQEALRGTFDPGYLFYTLGKLQILKLRDDYQKQEGTNFSLQKFHDLMLDNGMPSIRLLREVLLQDKSKWGEIL